MSPRPACRARRGNSSGAAPPRLRSGSTRAKSWRLFGYRVLDRLWREHRCRQDPPAGHDGGILLGRRRLDCVLDRPARRAGGYSGIGFSIGCGVNIDVAKTRLPGTTGEFFWGGAASTAFWIDPREELAVIRVSGSRSAVA